MKNWGVWRDHKEAPGWHTDFDGKIIEGSKRDSIKLAEYLNERYSHSSHTVYTAKRLHRPQAREK